MRGSHDFQRRGVVRDREHKGLRVRINPAIVVGYGEAGRVNADVRRRVAQVLLRAAEDLLLVAVDDLPQVRMSVVLAGVVNDGRDAQRLAAKQRPVAANVGDWGHVSHGDGRLLLKGLRRRHRRSGSP